MILIVIAFKFQLHFAISSFLLPKIMSKFYLTTAIDYANGKPHIGHAYEKILADVICRIKRLQGDDVHFLTGLDEHGQKVEQTANLKHISPQQLCDSVAEDFQSMCKNLNISYDDYIRTTQPRHKIVVQKILQQLFDNGDIYKAEYTGFYSTRVERFVQEKDKVNGNWPEDEFGEIVEITESNYFFKLAQHKQWLIKYIEENPDFIFPKYRAKQVLEFLSDDINDLCISRPKERMAWGIELPFDSEYVTYVWFDALINYISAIGYLSDNSEQFNKLWPVDFHVIGKDILVPAHAVYWPIMLHALNLPMPKCLLTHGWWMCSGEKMSKSVGNVINPIEYANKYGTDAFRYFVMREMNVGRDSDFSHEQFTTRYKSDLSNDLGNLISRCVNMLKRYTNSTIPENSIEEEPEKELKSTWSTILKESQLMLEEFQFHTALENIFSAIRATNRYLEIRAPWKLSKSTEKYDQNALKTCLCLCAEAIRISATILLPFMPTICLQIASIFDFKISSWTHNLFWNEKSLIHKHITADSAILFPRIEEE